MRTVAFFLFFALGAYFPLFSEIKGILDEGGRVLEIIDSGENLRKGELFFLFPEISSDFLEAKKNLLSHFTIQKEGACFEGDFQFQDKKILFSLRKQTLSREKVWNQLIDPCSKKIMHRGDFDPSREVKGILFVCDLVGFTSYSEKHTSKEVMDFLNSYFCCMGNIVEKRGGHINKFSGDSFLALFDPNVASENVLECAYAILEAEKKLSFPLHSVCSIHKGIFSMGFIGSETRKEFTVIGDTVNSAYRLQEIARKKNCSLILTEEVFSESPISYQERLSDLGNCTLRGKETSLHIYGNAIAPQ